MTREKKSVSVRFFTVILAFSYFWIPVFEAGADNLFPLRKWYFSQLLESEKGTFPFISVQSPLASFVSDPFPWFHLAANSEQRQPVYFGATPREISLESVWNAPSGRQPPTNPVRGVEFYPEIVRPVSVPVSLQDCGQKQLLGIYRTLTANGSIHDNDELIIEGWPIRDDYGQLSWAFARWKPVLMNDWRWFKSGLLPEEAAPKLNRVPVFPLFLDPTDPADFGKIFDDVLTLDLYDKPLFGDTVWTTGGAEENIIDAWPPVEMLDRYRNFLLSSMKISRIVPRCLILPQPARINGKPLSFFLKVNGREVVWPNGISWLDGDFEIGKLPPYRPKIRNWPANFSRAYRDDILVLDGEREAVFPITGRKIRFLRKNSIEKDNQLQDLVTYLEERYKILNVPTFRQDFVWRGIKQSNLIAVIPGTRPEENPVLMADHIDTAFCEEIYEETKKRVSAPGADDNFSATAVLLRAVEIFMSRKHERDIWLVHFTGEEFPADDLGARFFVSKLLREKRDIEGLILMDLIGHREKNDFIFQVNPGHSMKSLEMAKIAMDIAPAVCRFRPVMRSRYDDRSYLYNTDGLIFSENGFPTLYFNEHINKIENMDRIGYHHALDNSSKMDWEYATSIGKVAIETTAHLAKTK